MRERDDGSVTLNDLSVIDVRCFLDFAYTGEIEITEENVHMLFQLSSFLQVLTFILIFYITENIIRNESDFKM